MIWTLSKSGIGGRRVRRWYTAASVQAQAAGMAADPAPSFEQTLAELEALVERLEGGEISLEESLADFERGMAMALGLREQLDRAELRIRKVLEQGAAGAEPAAAAPAADE